MTERLANNAQTTLSSAINNVDNPAVFNVSVVDRFPTSGNFRVIVDGEIMLVTAVSGNQFTATRAQENTDIASHASGTKITHILTAGGLGQYVGERVGYGNYTGRPTAGISGRVYHANNINMSWIDDGTRWNLLHPIRVPGTWALDLTNTGTWTQFNGSSLTSTTVINEHSVIQTKNNGGFSNAGYYRSLPAAPFTATLALRGDFLNQQWQQPMFGFRLTSSGAARTMSYYGGDGTLRVDQWNSNTSYGATIKTYANQLSRTIFFRIRDDNTNWIYSYSIDGFHYNPFYTETRNSGFTPDSLMVGVGNAMSSADDKPYCVFYGLDIS